MSLQSIIRMSDSITINRRKVVGVQYTRNEILRTALTPTRNPWKFTVNATGGLVYSDSRAIMEELDRLDKITPSIISFGANPALSWLFDYQGSLSSSELNALRVYSFTGNQLVLSIPGVYGANDVIFAANDIIQIAGYPFPFTSTTTILGSQISGGKITITTHRPNFISAVVVNLAVTVGSNVQFKVLATNMPVYRLVPGAYRSADGVTINNARIEFDQPFEMVEYVG